LNPLPSHTLLALLAVGAVAPQLHAQTQAAPGTPAAVAAPTDGADDVVVDAGDNTSQAAEGTAGTSTVPVAPAATDVGGDTVTVSGASASAVAPTTTVPSPAVHTQATGDSVAASTAVAAAPEKKPEAEVELDGYVQVQYEMHADSSDQLRQGGATYNQDRFLVKRARLSLSRRWDFSGLYVELDGNTSGGPAFGVQRAEGSLFLPPPEGVKLPVIELTAGLVKLPFGRETPESSRSRWFMERTTASRAFFPSEVDVGASLGGAWRFMRYSVGLFNGQPKGMPSFQLQDPNSSKDLLVRLGADGKLSKRIKLSGSVSYLRGEGFHPGTDATKNQITWKDINENGNIDAGELTGSPGDAALPSENYDRWGVEADAQLSIETLLGATTIFAEGVFAANLDRGFFVADPAATGTEVRELGWHVGVTQELSKYSLVGLRYDHYDPNSDLMDSRAGKLYPLNQSVDTMAFVAGLSLPERARLVFEYDLIWDQLARSVVGTPEDLDNNQWTLRLQVTL
jgi:hypothetical protein